MTATHTSFWLFFFEFHVHCTITSSAESWSMFNLILALVSLVTTLPSHMTSEHTQATYVSSTGGSQDTSALIFNSLQYIRICHRILPANSLLYSLNPHLKGYKPLPVS